MTSFDYDEVYLDCIRTNPQHLDSRLSPIVLLHGVTSSKEKWRDVMQPIADKTKRQVIAFDARNHGDSGWSRKFNYDIMTEDLSRFLQSLSFHKVILIGHSLGGKVAMNFALKQPDLVEKLVVEDISPYPAHPSARQHVIDYIHLLRRSVEMIPPNTRNLTEAKRFVENFLNGITVQTDLNNEEQSFDDGYHLAMNMDQNGKFTWKANLDVIENVFINGFKYPLQWDGVFEKPVLFLCGTKSSFNVIKDKDLVTKVFPNSLWKPVEGASHQVHLEYPEKFIYETVNFINDIS